MKRAIAHLVDAALNLYAPTVHGRTVQVFTTAETVGPDWLTATEADIDVWEATESPDLPASAGDLAATPQASAYPGAGGPNPPAGAGSNADPLNAAEASATAPAGSSCTSDATVADLKVIASRVLRDCGAQWPATTADIVVRELLHHFEFHHK